MIVKTYKNRLYNLPEEILDIVFSFENPYKRVMKKVIFDIKWYIWWHKTVSWWRPQTTPDYHTWNLRIIKRMKKTKKRKSIYSIYIDGDEKN